MSQSLQNLQKPPAEEVVQGFWGAHFLDSRGDLHVEALVVSGGKIAALGSLEELKAQHPEAIWWDCRGYVLHPGFINGHTHVAMSFMREMAHVSQNMLEDVFFPLESRLTPELIEILSYPSLVMGMKSGVSCFVDHYYHIESVGRALEAFGVRGVIAETLNDSGGAMPGPERLKVAKELLERWPFSERIRPALGPHAMDTVSDKLAHKALEVQRHYGLPLHMHLSQTQVERERVQKACGLTPVERAQQLGLLGPQTLAVHLLSAEGSDWSILRDEGVFGGVCPSSQILYEHLVDLKSLEGEPVPAVLGTDCAASHDSMDLWAELRTYHLLRRQALQTPVSAELTLKAVWDHPAQWMGQKLGKLEVGYEADLGFTELTWELAPVHDLRVHFLLSLGSRNFKHLMVAGKWVLFQQEPVTLANSFWAGRYRQAVENLKPHMKTKKLLFPVLN